MSLATCCCGSNCKTPYNCYQAGSIEPDFIQFGGSPGVFAGTGYVDPSSIVPVSGVAVDFADSNTEARLTGNDVTFVSGVLEYTFVKWDFEIDIAYTWSPSLPALGGANCICTSGTYTPPASFGGVMNFSGTIQYRCCTVASTGEPCTPDGEFWSFLSSSGSSAGSFYNMAPDAASSCTAFRTRTFESQLLKKDGYSGGSLRPKGSCTALLNATEEFELEVRVPNAVSGCATDSFNPNDFRTTVILEVGFKVP